MCIFRPGADLGAGVQPILQSNCNLETIVVCTSKFYSLTSLLCTYALIPRHHTRPHHGGCFDGT